MHALLRVFGYTADSLSTGALRTPFIVHTPAIVCDPINIEPSGANTTTGYNHGGS